ncbi:transmembrane 9 superfamily member [Trichonephila clavata]|uniref:Transmembrane 9 superfamily member n=1 Tax=Trichonephila clavata TaxID=2740835 RepID=A0A8X6FES5_TRICU|nr:transmembrane 9 superfamily member [Trichonephila clavata]
MTSYNSKYLFILTIYFHLSVIWSFYLPGLAPVNYCEEGKATSTCQSRVMLYVNRLNSEESVIPYEYNQ